MARRRTGGALQQWFYSGYALALANRHLRYANNVAKLLPPGAPGKTFIERTGSDAKQRPPPVAPRKTFMERTGSDAEKRRRPECRKPDIEVRISRTRDRRLTGVILP